MKAPRLMSFVVSGLLAVAPSGCERLCAQSGGVGVFCPESQSNPLNRPPKIDSINVRPIGAFIPGVDVRFEALVFEPDGDDLFFEWDLNDDGRFESSGTSKAGEWTPTVSRVFSTPGSFRVRLRVTDFPERLGAPGDVSATKTIIIRESFENPNSAPIAAFTARPNPTRPYEAVQFDGRGSSDPDPADFGRLSYLWDFRDEGLGDRFKSGPRAERVYETAGLYRVALTVSDDFSEDAVAHEVTVLRYQRDNTPPSASFTVSPAAPRVGQQVTFDGSASSDPDGAVVRYDWDLNGDGDFESGGTGEPRLMTTLETVGARDVGLRVIDAGGGEATVTRRVNVFANQRPTASFDIIPNPAHVDEGIRLDASASSDPDGAVKRWEWDLNDDGVFETDDGDIPEHHLSYGAQGDHVVALRVTDNFGLVSDPVSGTISVIDSQHRAFAALPGPFSPSLAPPSGAAPAPGAAPATTLPFSARLDGRPLPDGRGRVRRQGRRLTLAGVLGRGTLRADLLDLPGRGSAAERSLRRFLNAPWRTRMSFGFDRSSKRWTASAIALARVPRGETCLRLHVTAFPGQHPSGRFTVLGGGGVGARLRANGALRFRLEPNGTATALGRISARNGRARGLPASCRRLR